MGWGKPLRGSGKACQRFWNTLQCFRNTLQCFWNTLQRWKRGNRSGFPSFCYFSSVFLRFQPNFAIFPLVFQIFLRFKTIFQKNLIEKFAQRNRSKFGFPRRGPGGGASGRTIGEFFSETFFFQKSFKKNSAQRNRP